MGRLVNATARPLYPWERRSTHCIGGWVGPRAGLDGANGTDGIQERCIQGFGGET
jgi:hypothetical protein